MKAYVLHDIGDLRLESVKDPRPDDGEVLVKIKAAGICGSDIPRIYHTGAYSYPLIPGHEFAGTVVNAGEGVDRGWVGKRVGVFPLIPCGKCGPCREERYELCRAYSYLGSRRNGGFAEYAVVPAWNLLELPEGVTFEEAAMLEPMAVAVHAIRRAAPQSSDTIVLCGLGTIGLFLLMFLKDIGMENILVIGNKNFQREKALALGLDSERFCDSRKQVSEDWILEKTDGKGTDVFFECVGRNETVELSISCAAPVGRVMLVGNPHSYMTFDKANYWKILRNQLTVMGTWNSSFTHDREDDWHYVLDRLMQGCIRPSELITHRYCKEGLIKGFEMMRDKTENYIKVTCHM